MLRDDLVRATQLGHVSLSFGYRLDQTRNIDRTGEITRIPATLLDAAKAVAR